MSLYLLLISLLVVPIRRITRLRPSQPPRPSRQHTRLAGSSRDAVHPPLRTSRSRAGQATCLPVSPHYTPATRALTPSGHLPRLTRRERLLEGRSLHSSSFTRV
ncbi:uncharacterized protein SCHCODRAFT_02077638 [Schizophyllum commune H4-8]|uniref:uncharacterized protein n=1 Tax=Schizophyllum commune (strain H4-8 / FGSC 9210) TaxID=578458 RepID=UPI00215EA52A|nr:uncharacterized protein SCHCODRAFT_02077638 [Schizophyllum commune H4-8]KAI5887999.1 hypothetical protein SCHCODRAFT_02077638 [Schizophyllum commune H4-8]